MTYDINDPLGLSEMTAKECVVCGLKDTQEDIVEAEPGFAHRDCLPLTEEEYKKEALGETQFEEERGN